MPRPLGGANLRITFLIPPKMPRLNRAYSHRMERAGLSAVRTSHAEPLPPPPLRANEPVVFTTCKGRADGPPATLIDCAERIDPRTAGWHARERGCKPLHVSVHFQRHPSLFDRSQPKNIGSEAGELVDGGHCTEALELAHHVGSRTLLEQPRQRWGREDGAPTQHSRDEVRTTGDPLRLSKV